MYFKTLNRVIDMFQPMNNLKKRQNLQENIMMEMIKSLEFEISLLIKIDDNVIKIKKMMRNIYDNKVM